MTGAMVEDGRVSAPRPSIIHLPQPAAGADVTFGIPGSEYMALYAVAFTLATSAAVATRTPVLELLDGASRVLAGCAAGLTCPAATTTRYSYVYGLAEWDFASTTFASGPVPRVPLAIAETIVIHVDGVQAADQLSDVVITVLQQPSGYDSE